MSSSYSVVKDFLEGFGTEMVALISPSRATTDLKSTPFRSGKFTFNKNTAAICMFGSSRDQHLNPIELLSGLRFMIVGLQNFSSNMSPVMEDDSVGLRRRSSVIEDYHSFQIKVGKKMWQIVGNEMDGSMGHLTLLMSHLADTFVKWVGNVKRCGPWRHVRASSSTGVKVLLEAPAVFEAVVLARVRKWKECYFDSDSCITINAILEGKKNPILEIDDTMSGDFPNCFFMIIKSSRTDNILAHNTVEYQRLLFEDPVFGVFPILVLGYIPVVFVVAFLVVVVCVALPVGF